MTDAMILQDLQATQQQVQQHKAAMRREKAALHDAAERLARLERACRQRGIRFIPYSPAGVESPSHGPDHHTETRS